MGAPRLALGAAPSTPVTFWGRTLQYQGCDGTQHPFGGVFSTHGCPYLTLGAVRVPLTQPRFPSPPPTIYLLYLFLGYLIGGNYLIAGYLRLFNSGIFNVISGLFIQ